MHLFGTSYFICSLTHPPLFFYRTRAIVSVVCSTVFSANPVKPYERCVAPQFDCLGLVNSVEPNRFILG